MRIVAGSLRGRPLIAPPGTTTRPTSDRARQTLFDMLLHAPWAGRDLLEDAHILDAFAGTGALGLEALSRGAAHATFFEPDRAALTALRTNIARCTAEPRCTVLPTSCTTPPPAHTPCTIAFLDPPYASTLIPTAVTTLTTTGWLTPTALLIAETARDAPLPTLGTLLTNRPIGAARISVWRAG